MSRRTGSSRSRSQDPQEEQHTMSTRSTRSSRVVRSALSARTARSIAETEHEATGTEGEEEGAQRARSSSPSGDEGQEGAESSSYRSAQHSRYSFSHSGGSFARSPYVTRSTSKSRGPRPAAAASSLTSSLAAAASRVLGRTPTKALSFTEEEEEEEDSDESSDSVGGRPVRFSRLTGRQLPGTPGERDAHDDAGVYQQDVCDSHEVYMPDGSITHRPHTCPHASHRRPSPLPPAVSPAKAQAPAAVPGPNRNLAAYMVLTMLLIGLMGPWALKQLTHRPPSFVGEPGHNGAVMTQAHLDELVSHVMSTVRADLSQRQLVEQRMLDQTAQSLTQQLTSSSRSHVASSVSEATKDLMAKVEARMAQKGTDDAAALREVRTELLSALESRSASSAKEWSQRVSDAFTAQLGSETSERRDALQRLSDAFQRSVSEERERGNQEREQVRKSVMGEIEALMAAERSSNSADVASKYVTRTELESKLAALVQAEAEEDASTLAAALASLRSELPSLLDARISSALSDWEPALRTRILTAASELFEPLSKGGEPVVVTPAREVDEAALEERVANALRARVDELAAANRKQEAEAEVNELLRRVREEIPQLVSPLLPTPQEAPVVDANTPAVAELHEQIRQLKAELQRTAQENAIAIAAASNSAAEASAAASAASAAAAASAVPASASSVDVTSQISAALELFGADRTGQVDYALASSGGKVAAATPSHQVELEGNVLQRFSQKCLMAVRKPEEMIQADMSVGRCWPLHGSSGSALLELRERITPSSVTLQHVSRFVAPDQSSTPKRFQVWGVSDQQVQAETSRIGSAAHHTATPVGTLLGEHSYDVQGPQVQTFPLTAAAKFKFVTVAFLSNHGNPGYTCIYRVRVHGQP